MNRSTLARVGGRLGRAALIFVTVIILIVGGSFLFLLTWPGGKLLKSVIVSQVNRSIPGHLTIAGLTYRGDKVTLRDVVLLAPDGGRVGSAALVLVDISVRDLIHKRIHIDRLLISNYDLRLIREPDGRWNANAATSYGAKPSNRPPPNVVVDQLVLEKGAVQVLPQIQAGARAVPPATVRDLGFAGSVAYRDGVLSAALTGRGEVDSPIKCQLGMDTRAGLERDAQSLRLFVGCERNELLVSGRLPPGQRLANLDKLDWRRVEAHLRLDVAALESGGSTFGPLSADIAVADGRLVTANAEATLPGLKLSVATPPDASSVSASVEVASLADTVRALEPWIGLAVPPLDARGSIRVRLVDPLHPAGFTLNARFPYLVVSTTRAEAVGLDVSVEKPARPLTAPVEATLSAASVSSSERRVARPRVHLAVTRAHRFSLEARTGPDLALQLDVQGDLSPSADTLVLDRFRVQYPSTIWALAGPARILRRPGGVDVVDFVLASGPQTVRLDVAWAKTQKHSEVNLANLRLSSLPTALLGRRDKPLRGRIDGHVRLDSLGGAPAVKLDLSFRVPGLPEFAARLHSEYAAGRASGNLSASMRRARALGDFDIALAPASGPRTLQASLTSDLQLAELWRLLRTLGVLPAGAERVQDIAGDFQVNAQATGELAAPSLTARVALRGGRVALQGGQRLGNVNLLVEGDQRRLTLRDLSATSGEGRVDGHGTLARVGDGQRARYDLQLSSRAFPIPSARPPLWVDAEARLTGTLSPAVVTGRLDVYHVRGVEHPPRATGRRAGITLPRPP